jgi:hypothetical protein
MPQGGARRVRNRPAIVPDSVAASNGGSSRF